jgi:hypothetical protein
MSPRAPRQQALREQQGKGPGEPAPSRVLESLDRQLDRTLVGDGRAQAGQSPETAPAAAVPSRMLHLGAAAAAHRLLEVPDPPAASFAEPRPDDPAGPAPGRQQEIHHA